MRVFGACTMMTVIKAGIIAAAIAFAFFRQQITEFFRSLIFELPGIKALLYYSTPNMKLYIACNYVAVAAVIVLLVTLVWVRSRVLRIAVSLGMCAVVAGTWYSISGFTTALPDYALVHFMATLAAVLLALFNSANETRLWPEKARAPDPRVYVLD